MNMPRASNTSALLDTPIANQPTNNLEASLLQKTEDLGRLAIKLEHTANGTNIVFIAERAKTQELMKRQMEFLHQQFKN